MATTGMHHKLKINKENQNFTPCRMIIETAFYGNQVSFVHTLAEAYSLASSSPGAIVTDHVIKEAQQLGLPEDAKVLVFNDGKNVARTPAARKNLNRKSLDYETYSADLRQALFDNRHRKFFRAEAVVGMHHDFMVKAHFMVPEGWEHLLYQWLLNFTPLTEAVQEQYESSLLFKDEADVFLLALPDYEVPGHSKGLSLFDGEGNCGAILGLNTFVEYKKGTLSLAWSVAERRDFVPFHGGQKKYIREDGSSRTIVFAGLTGSGKSIFIHHKNSMGYEEQILHDDALIISANYGSSISMEPGYFEKSGDYDFTDKHFTWTLAAQNQGVTINHHGEKTIVAGDIRNDNGRVILGSKAYKNRVNVMDQPPTDIIWLIKDPVLPPVIKVTDPVLALSFAATLSNMIIKKTDSDLLKENEPLVIQPFANPFRTYPAVNDYIRLEKLIRERQISTYIMNTGYFMGREISKELSISVLEQIFSDQAQFVPWQGCDGLNILEILGYQPDFSDSSYKTYFISRLKERMVYLTKEGFPGEAAEALEKILKRIE